MSASAATGRVGGNTRFARDVLIHKPTAMTADFGMNDGGYGGFSRGRLQARTCRGLQGMADQAKAANIRLCLGHSAAAR